MSLDPQRSAVYAAEQRIRVLFDNAAHGAASVEIANSTITLPPERRFACLDSIQTYVDAVLVLNWVREQWPRSTVPVRVRERKGLTAAHYERATATIAIPTARTRSRTPWAMRELTVLHEIAHHLTDCGHGPHFARTFADLAGGIIGPEARYALEVTFADEDVSVA